MVPCSPHLPALPSFLVLLLSYHALGATKPGVRNFKGYKVFSVTPEDPGQVSWLLDLQQFLQTNSSISCSSSPESLDWWSEPGRLNTSALVSVDPGCQKELKHLLEEKGVNYKITINDLQKLIRKEKRYEKQVKFHWDSQNWSPEIFNDLEDIEERLDYLICQHPDLLTRQKLGTTFEGRDISAIVIRQPGPRTKPVIWLDCGIHARELASPPACLHAINSLVQDSNSVNPRENLLSAFDFYVLSVANPDGYVHARKHNRMWRKNRHPGSFCVGVDPNRNFDADFHSASQSQQECDQSYRGRAAFSEAESSAIRTAISSIQAAYGRGRIAAFVSVHAFSQFWMSPMGYTRTHPKDHNDHMRVMKIATNALAGEYGTRFKFGPISEVIYVAAGSSVDWAYENAGIKYSFGLELRPRQESKEAETYGFFLPQDQIYPTVRETWAGLKAMAWAIQPEFPVKQAPAAEGLPGNLEITFG